MDHRQRPTIAVSRSCDSPSVGSSRERDGGSGPTYPAQPRV